MAKPTQAELAREGGKLLRGMLETLDDFEVKHVQGQLEEAEEHRDTCEARQKVVLATLLLDPKLYRRFAGAEVIDLTKSRQLSRVVDRAMASVDAEARRLERALVPRAARIKEPGSGA